MRHAESHLMSVKAGNRLITLFFVLSIAAECTLELYKQLLMAKPVCEDEIQKLYEASLDLAEPNDKLTIEDIYGAWTLCKSKMAAILNYHVASTLLRPLRR